MAVSFSFLILVNEDEVLRTFEIDLSDRSDMGFLFLILSIVTAMALSWERRRALSVGDAYKSILTVLAILLIPLPIVMLSLAPTSIVTILSAIIIIPLAGVVLFFFRSEARDMGITAFFFIALGSIMTLYGIMFSIKNMELTGIIWFLSGKHVALMGMIILGTGSYLAISKISIISKSIGPPFYFSLSTILFMVLVLYRNGSEGYNGVFDLLMVLPLMLLTISTSSFLVEVVNDQRIDLSNAEMMESLSRSEELEKRKRSSILFSKWIERSAPIQWMALEDAQTMQV